MTKLKNAAGQVIATMRDDLTVWKGGEKLGRVDINGDVWDVDSKVGTFNEKNGYVYQGSKHIGTVDAANRVVRDYELQPVGKIEGTHVMLGGAALLLLAR